MMRDDWKTAVRKAFKIAPVALGLVFLAGCAAQNWTPGPDARGTFEEASAKCSLMARHSGSGFYAQGSANFVAGAALGAAIGDAIRANADFNDCMAASGWVVADKDSAARAQAMNNQVAAMRNEYGTCIDAIRSKPRYAPLLPHLLDTAVGHYSLTQMSDEHRPSVEEAGLLASYGDEADVCHDKLYAEVVALDPRAGPTMQAVRGRVRELDLALINRQLTWGDYARRAQDAVDDGPGAASTTASNDAAPAPSNEANPPEQTAQGFQSFNSWPRQNPQNNPGSDQ